MLLNGSFGHCQRCANTELKDNEDFAYVPSPDNLTCMVNCEDNEYLEPHCGNIFEKKIIIMGGNVSSF